MKRITLRLICICLLAALALPCLVGCDSGANYRDDVAVADISTALKTLLPTPDGYYAADSDYLGFYFDGADGKVAEHVIEFSATSTNINQFGIFKVKDGEAEAIKTLCEQYISTMKDRWVAQANYIASEHPKMENAEVRIFGNYVVYVMLTATDKTAAFDKVDELLKK